MALETQIAERHWPIADRRDRDRTYNLKTRAEIRALAPRFPWDAVRRRRPRRRAGSRRRRTSRDGPAGASCSWRRRLSTWKDYLTYHLLRNNAAVLPQRDRRREFRFLRHDAERPAAAARTLEARGASASTARSAKRSARSTCSATSRRKPRRRCCELVENLRRAYGERIDRLTWMSAETKVAAREKLATFRPKIGYPDRWRDYSALEVRAGDALRQRQAPADLRLELRSRASAAPDRQGRVVHDAANGERLLQPGVQRDRVPGRDPAAAVLRSERRPGRELRRHRRRHRPRNGPRLRRPGREVRRARRAARLVERQRTSPRSRKLSDTPRGAIRRVRAAARHQRQRPPDARRKHRRQWRPASVACTPTASR